MYENQNAHHLLLLALITAAVAMKLAFLPSVKDAYFTMNGRKLQQAPGGEIIYASSPGKGGDGVRRMGCNVPLRDVIATASGWSCSRTRRQSKCSSSKKCVDFRFAHAAIWRFNATR